MIYALLKNKMNTVTLL